jgi:hypothetical protein
MVTIVYHVKYTTKNHIFQIEKKKHWRKNTIKILIVKDQSKDIKILPFVL